MKFLHEKLKKDEELPRQPFIFFYQYISIVQSASSFIG